MTDRFPEPVHSITAFFPAYNDADSLPALIASVFEVLPRVAADFEVIVVNDGSHDNTSGVLAELAQRYGPRMKVVTHTRNRGYGGALRSGFANATKDWVFYTDADGQYDVAELISLVERVAPDVGLVNGYKLHRSDPWHRVWIGRVYNALARLMFRIRIRDIDCDFRLIRRSLLDSFQLTATSGAICVELVRKIELSSFRVVEVGVHHYPRQFGRSQFFRIPSLLTTFMQLADLYLSTVFLAPARKPQRGKRKCASL